VLLVICAYSLFLFTAIAGRLWCGYACPQTVYTEIFMWIERKIEGARSARMRLDKQPWSLEKSIKKLAKHIAWGSVALWTGISFVGYFTPISLLMKEIVVLMLGPWEWFWVLFYAFATYGNAVWMREQVCKYMCPYARFQSAMFDKDTWIITYDAQRGEPRSPLSKHPDRLGSLGQSKGECIDCKMCVQVCPTGIDIRQGLQYDCIGCAACIDACDAVMDKIDLPRGLIRYSTENALNNHLTPQQIRRRTMRPRVIIYSLILFLIVSAFLGAFMLRKPLKLDVIRDRGAMGREVEDGMIENVYRLQIMNTDETAHRYKISVSGIDTIALASPSEVNLQGTASRAVPVRVRVEKGQGHLGSNQMEFILTSFDAPDMQVKERAVFFVPRNE